MVFYSVAIAQHRAGYREPGEQGAWKEDLECPIDRKQIESVSYAFPERITR